MALPTFACLFGEPINNDIIFRSKKLGHGLTYLCFKIVSIMKIEY